MVNPRDERRNPIHIIQGRFNYLSVKTNLYNVIFLPFRGASAYIVARNLDKDLATDLIDSLNEALDAARKELEDEMEDE